MVCLHGEYGHFLDKCGEGQYFAICADVFYVNTKYVSNSPIFKHKLKLID